MALAFGVTLVPPASAQDAKKEAKKDSKTEKRAEAIRKDPQATLAKLYKAKPGAKAAIDKAAGYAAFDNFGMNLFVISTASGKGMVVDKASKKRPT